MRERFISFLTILSKPVVAIGGALALGILIVGGAWYATTISPSGSATPVTVGAITEEVDVTGVVQAAHSTDLAFQAPGRVASIAVQVGDHVALGQTLAVLDGSSQAAAVALAKANVGAQLARLDSLKAGTRPEQIAIDETNVAQALNALTSALSSAAAAADDAVHAKADQVFSNPRNSNAQLAILVPDETLVNRVLAERTALESLLSSWQAALSGAGDIGSLVTSSEVNVRSVTTFLNDLITALAEAQPSGALSATALVGAQTSVQAGRSNIAASLSMLINADTAYKASVGALTLAQAGATPNDLAAQQATVDAAQASVAAAEAQASQTVIRAPVSGIITVQNANLGETVAPGAPLISMIADGKYQAIAELSEADIAKVKVNDKAEARFAAYPDATFAGIVTTVNPAASMNGGVASYGVTITFSANDARLFPGLSANLHIVTQTKDAVLLVPTSAVITDGTQKFVQVRTAKGIVRANVTTGIESASGMTEILSGLTKGDSVLIFGAP